jgi:hypothetical protein
MLGHLRDAIDKTLGDEPKPDAKAQKQKRAKAAKTAKAADAPASGASKQLEMRIRTDPLKVVQVEPTRYTLTPYFNAASNRRAAALKLFDENHERAARIRELRMKAQALEAEIEALRAQLEK